MRTCQRCLMDETTTHIKFYEASCSFCFVSNEKNSLPSFANTRYPRKTTKKYDSIVGLSGGVDSCYSLVKAVEAGWRPLVFHYNNGWNSNLSTENIENLVSSLGLDLVTYVTPWKVFKSLQRALFNSDVVDLELVTDHAVFATLYTTAYKYGIRTLITGHNNATESILPKDWCHRKYDFKNIQSIAKAHNIPIKNYPGISLSKWIFLENYYLDRYNILDTFAYNKVEAENELIEKFGYKPYHGKHGESVFTRFYQSYILPNKFGIDKRKAHLSSEIKSGLLDRDQAKKELDKYTYIASEEFKDDLRLIFSKLDFDEKSFNEYMTRKPRSHFDYKSDQLLYESLRRIRQMMRT